MVSREATPGLVVEEAPVEDEAGWRRGVVAVRLCGRGIH